GPSGSSGTLERELADLSRSPKVVHLAQDHRRVVAQVRAVAAGLPLDLDHRGLDRERLLVPTEPPQRHRSHAAAAQPRLDAVHLVPELGSSGSELERAPVVACPVREICMKVRMVGALERAHAGTPARQSVVPELECTVKVSLVAALRERLADDCRRSDARILVVELVRVLERPLRSLESLLVLLGPDVRLPGVQQPVEQITALELRQDRFEILERCGMVEGDDEGERAAQPDLRAPPPVLGELERLRAE